MSTLKSRFVQVWYMYWIY